MPEANQTSDPTILTTVETWLTDVVIGLNLCPFAAKPHRLNQIRIDIFNGNTEQALLDHLQVELERLDQEPAEQLETTVIVIPHMLIDFFEYNQFLDYADFLVRKGGWEGVYQIASFHPDYCFADAAPGDASNLTNQSPYPILHLLREHSLEEAIEKYPDTDAIPETNIKKMNHLEKTDIERLFPYLRS